MVRELRLGHAGWRVPRFESVAVFSKGIGAIRFLESFVGARRLVMRPSAKVVDEVEAVVGWGHKPSAAAARRYAEQHRLPYLRLEDGFLRSAGVGKKGHPLSLVLDHRGIYYDSTQPSRLEMLLNGDCGDELSPGLLQRAGRCREAIVEHGLSKYNHTTEGVPAWLLAESRPRVLVVDQTKHDASISLGGASSASFQQMLEAALDEHPEATVVVKTHPDVWTSGARGYLTNVRHPRVRILSDPTDPAQLLDAVDVVYTATSQLGFEALLRHKPVTCFGIPFYAGWGLTQDRVPIPKRTRRRNLDELVAAALILYPRYVHPVTGERIPAEVAIEHLALQRHQQLANRGTSFCFGFSWWKKRYVRQYLAGGRVVFCTSVSQARRAGIDAQSRIIVWGSRKPAGLKQLETELGIHAATMEDGFLRSAGLGSDFHPPVSLVLDPRGIYYDPSQPSAFEQMAQTHRFSSVELTRARALRERILRLGVSKYNFKAGPDRSLNIPSGKRVILVPGQVADDASILLGSPVCRDDAALLRAVRQQHPDAYILYKVHPEVVTGNRGRAQLIPGPELYDAMVAHAPLEACLRAAHEVHTMTSLVGFEALMRCKRVVTYGQPFYAGWGLTRDMAPIQRRGRMLCLDELVALALLQYPTYYSWSAGAFTSAEYALDELKGQAALGGRVLKGPSGRVRRTARRLAVWLRGAAPLPATRITGVLEGRHVVLLQGPVGPFFARLAQALELAGARVTKVNFNAGDDFAYRRSGALQFRGGSADWSTFLERMFSDDVVDAVVLFGDSRKHHRVAVQQAKERNVAVYVFEEGYLRPDYVTLERGGVNARSTLPRDLETYVALAKELARRGHAPKAYKVQNGFRMLAWYSALYSLSLTVGSGRYPQYRHHKDLRALRQILNWSRGYMRKAWYAKCERSMLSEICEGLHKSFFLVPLQVHHDAQVMDSVFGSNEAFIERVLCSFSAHAESDVHLVFKHHPLDRAYRDYAGAIHSGASRFGVSERVHYVHDLHLPSLLRAARGTVVLNSTTGCASLHHRTPVIAMGAAVYNLNGLTFQGTLDEFWRSPGRVSGRDFERFKTALIAMSQVNGCFYSTDITEDVVARLARDLSRDWGEEPDKSTAVAQAV